MPLCGVLLHRESSKLVNKLIFNHLPLSFRTAFEELLLLPPSMKESLESLINVLKLVDGELIQRFPEFGIGQNVRQVDFSKSRILLVDKIPKRPALPLNRGPKRLWASSNWEAKSLEYILNSFVVTLVNTGTGWLHAAFGFYIKPGLLLLESYSLLSLHCRDDVYRLLSKGLSVVAFLRSIGARTHGPTSISQVSRGVNIPYK